LWVRLSLELKAPVNELQERVSSTEFLDYCEALGWLTREVVAEPQESREPPWKKWKQGLSDFDAKLRALAQRKEARRGR